MPLSQMLPQNPHAIAAPDVQPAADPTRHVPRLPVLDGWRGISILLVLICHAVPLGPPSWALNEDAGIIGMAVFFSLSGFLIVSTLYFDTSLRNFTIRRTTRILPLAWLFLLLVLPPIHASPLMWRANLLFYANVWPMQLVPINGHFWSLCIEVQFYLAIGLLFFLLRRKVFPLLPLACVAITALRIAHGELHSIETPYRLDEILSGATLAWLFHSRASTWLRRALTWLNPIVPIVLLCLSAHAALPWLNPGRAYFAALAVGTTLFHPATRWSRFFESTILAGLATLSYALYVWQPITLSPPFWHHNMLTSYISIQLGLPITFLLAYCSTMYFERFWTKLGKSALEPARP